MRPGPVIVDGVAGQPNQSSLTAMLPGVACYSWRVLFSLTAKIRGSYAPGGPEL